MTATKRPAQGRPETAPYSDVPHITVEGYNAQS